MSTPVLLADPHRDIAPHSYVIQINTSQCQACGHIGQSCVTWAKTFLRGKFGGKYSTNLRPLNEPPKYRLPIERILAPIQNIPFCDRCLDPNELLKSLPYPPEERNLTPQKPDGSNGAPAAPRPTTAKKKTTTTDDLMEGLDL